MIESLMARDEGKRLEFEENICERNHVQKMGNCVRAGRTILVLAEPKHAVKQKPATGEAPL